MLDFDRLKAASTDDLVCLTLCEFSRFVDVHERLASALERIAPTAAELQQVSPSNSADTIEAPNCPCPPDLRVKCDAVMGQPVSYRCGLCDKPVQQPVGA